MGKHMYFIMLFLANAKDCEVYSRKVLDLLHGRGGNAVISSMKLADRGYFPLLSYITGRIHHSVLKAKIYFYFTTKYNSKNSQAPGRLCYFSRPLWGKVYNTVWLGDIICIQRKKVKPWSVVKKKKKRWIQFKSILWPSNMIVFNV